MSITDTKKLNILFLSGWYPNRVLSTLGNFVQKHAEAVALHSNVIALHVCADADCKQTYEITRNTVNNVFTINVYYKKVSHHIPLISNILKIIRSIKAYSAGLKIVKEKFTKADLVHHNIIYPSGLIAWYLKKFKNIPYIVTEHSTAYLPSKNKGINFSERVISKMICRNAAVIIPVSRDLQKALINHGFSGKYEIVYNVVDTKLFYPPKQKEEKHKIKFLHISTLDDAHKNISGMLHAIKVLSEKRTDFECLFAGDGDILPHIETAKKLNIYNTFAFFEGIKTTSEIAEMMRKADCFLLFSNYENLPVVIIEALACGLPVVSSDVGGIHEHITTERGMLVEAKNEKALTEAMDRMITSIQSKHYNTQALAAYAKENFSYEKVSEKFHHLYQQVIKNNV